MTTPFADLSEPGAAFYEPLSEHRFRATEHTAGPWSQHAQHLGPVSALLVREVERCAPRAELAVRRVSVDVLGPVPVTELELHAEVIRPGRSVELVTASVSAGGTVAATARAWRMVRGDTAEVAQRRGHQQGDPGEWSQFTVLSGWSTGYSAAMDWRAAPGTPAGRGSAHVWARQRMPLVAGEQPSGLQRLFTLVDSTSGVSAPLDFQSWSFVNTDLTVHLERSPQGEWIGLDATTVVGPDGAGTASSVVHDGDGPLGRSAQTLLITPR